jgi:hypothetical protein
MELSATTVVGLSFTAGDTALLSIFPEPRSRGFSQAGFSHKLELIDI